MTFVLAVLLTLVTALVDDTNLSTLAVPIIAVLLLHAMWRAPIRHSLYVLMFCALTLENPVDGPAAGQWHSPLFSVGALLLTHLNMWTGIPALMFSGMDFCLVFLFLVAWYRRTTGSTIDRMGQTPTPKPLVQLASLSLAGTAFVWLIGVFRGGDQAPALWQIDRVVHLPLVFLLFHMGLRGTKDYVALGRTVLAAATVKACLATYIMETVKLPPDQDGNTSLPYATTHHDSILFAVAAVMLVSMVIHRASRNAVRIALVLLPILILGMIENSRRMVWVQIGMVFLTLYLVMPNTTTKRKITKFLYAVGPFLAIYIVIGWGSHSGFFKPVQTIRSVVDPASDGSTMTREIENFDLIYTLRAYPIFGTGYGIPYWEVWPLPYMGYALEQFCPHNSLLGLWVYAGIAGYTAMTLLWCAGVYFGMRAYHSAREPKDRAAALITYGAVLIYLLQCWGDMGLGSWIGVFTLGPALAMAGKLAVATGAWSVPQRKARTVTARAGEAAAGQVAATVGFSGSKGA